MSILINRRTTVLVQGITGKEGSRAAAEMQAYGTRVVAGVTPGKGGQTTPTGIPVYDTVAEALIGHPDINATLVAVPRPFAYDATSEAIAHQIPLINILTEKIPVLDVARLIKDAAEQKVRLVGPSSVGIITPGASKLGSIGSSDAVKTIFTPGPVGLISKSGGMTSELAYQLSSSGFGQSTALGIGGDLLICTDFLDSALQFEKDRQTKVIVIFGEIGGVYEEKLADAIRDRRVTKPVVALIAGHFAATLPNETVLGHAGAIVGKKRGSAQSKITALARVGVRIARNLESVPRLVRQVLT